MIVTKLKGGLGNQMFQYAIGRCLAHKFGKALFIDKTFYFQAHSSAVTAREFALKNYNIKAFILPNIIADPFARRKIVRNDTNSRNFFAKRFVLISEEVSNFDFAVEKLDNDIILDGYWQSEKYFSDIAKLIKLDFMPIVPISSPCLRILKTIRSCNSASIHVRRGDYVTNLAAADFHGTCSVDWYREAVSLLSNITYVERFLIFSDDITWAKSNLQFVPRAIFIDSTIAETDIEDLYLMSQCRHNIIANSSFSWWAAWLNNYGYKTVIAPKKWFKHETNIHDRIPSSWIVL